ncbi:hypothetical protein FRC03_005312 [Tulasnella sp. 419]|nr:hypothetical protein FRC03_005312 [Tulasnella sp. 419]
MASNTKTVAVLPDSELKDGQVKEVVFGEGKVLLSRVRGQVHATSAFCTHYGAPLAKGVLESSGRIVCPWHGACFNVCTGDIEDAPALDSLHSFKATVEDGQILVTAVESDTLKKNMTRPVKILSAASATTESNGVVIVGGGAGALHTMESLRYNEYAGPITVISSEPYAPIDRTRLSKALVTDVSKVEWRSPEVWKEKYAVNLRLNEEVTSVDTDAKTVTVGESEKVRYDNLVLAVGSSPKRLPIPGADLENVFTLRKLADSQKIDAALTPGKRLTVVGSSFISMELVAAVAKRELGSIDVIGTSEVPFEPMLGKEVGAGIMKYHQNNGAKFHMKARVKALLPSPSSPTSVGAVELADGTKVEADVVVLGVGVSPATQFLKGTQLEQALQKDGGLLVDNELRVQGVKDVFAIGDIAVYPQAQGGTLRRIEHWNVANNHGRAVGQILGKTPQLAVSYEKVPIFWSAQGQQLRYCGLGAGFDDVLIKGNPDEMKFAAFYFKEGKVIAVASMQSDPLNSKCAELLRLGLMPSAEELRAGKDPLTIDIATHEL